VASAANPLLPTPGAIPAATPTALQGVITKWSQRRQIAVSQGFNPAPIDALYKQDWAKVAAGGAAMTAEEAQASVDAAYTGSGPITKGRPTGPKGVLENIIPDVASTLWNFPAGVANLVHHLPSEASTALGVISGNAADRRKIGWETGGASLGSRLAAGLRNASRTPLVNLLPGLHEAAGLTTGAGRASLQQHPVGDVLDVLPLAGGAARLGVLGDAAAEGVQAGAVASEAEKLAAGGRIDLADKVATQAGFKDYADLVTNTPRSSRVAEALSSGRPLKALIRAVPKLDEARLSLLDHFNATPLAKGFRRTTIMAESHKAQTLEQHTRNVLRPMVAGLSEEEVAAIGHMAPRPELWPSATPKQQAVLDMLRANGDIRRAEDVAAANLLPFNVKGHEVVYAGEQADRLAGMKGRLDTAIAKSHAAEDAVYRAKQNYPDGSPEVTSAVNKANNARALVDKRDRLMSSALARTVPPAYGPQVEDAIRQKVMTHLQGKLGDTPQFDEAMAAYDRGKPLAAYLPEKTLAKYEAEARKNWQALIREDTPIWIPSFSEADLERALHPIRFKDKPSTPSAWKSRYVNRSVGSTNYVLALGKAEAERVSNMADQAVTDTFILPLAKTTSDIDKELEASYAAERKRTGQTTPDAQVQNKIRSAAYRQLDESLGLGSTPQMRKTYAEHLWIPSDLADAISKSMEPKRYNELQALNMASIRLFKFTVMGLSPTHQAHIWLGSALPMLAGGGFEELNPTRWIDGFHMSKAMTFGHADDLAKLSDGAQRSIGLLNRSLDTTNAEDLMDYAHGLTIGRLAGKAVGAVEMSRKLSELGANMYRSIAYLSEEARSLRGGMDPELAAAHGVMYANKTFVDIGGMTPIEQYVAKNIYPFYSYSAWALRYLMQYPVDHPIRASVLARLGEHEAAYNQSKGIPNTMAMLFNLGKPNSQGDQWGIQLRAFNPFRNAGTTFTMAGILGGLNPALRTLFTQAGVSTLSGTPDPFPGLDIDPNTGGLVGTTKGGSPLAAAEQVVPQLSLLDHYLGLSQQARALRSSDPQAFRRQVFSILNMPFVPQTYTPYLTEGAHARDQLRVAQAAVSSAIKSQDLSSLSIYDNVPVPAKVKPYVGNVSFMPYPQFAKAVDAIFAWEKQTGQKVI
jgi:hypothetical protein